MSLAETYHTATKYAPATIAQGGSLDWSQQPSPFKTYPSDGQIELAGRLPFARNPFTGDAQTPPRPQPGVLDLTAVSRWLYGSYGITGVVAGNDQPLYLRAAPSAGGLYPAEVYLLAQQVPGLRAGLYGYVPLGHHLAPLAAADAPARLAAACYGSAAIAQAGCCLIITGVFGRSSWRYKERGYRRVLLDSGHLIGNAQLLASALGLHAHLCTAFCDAALNALLGIEDSREGALAIVALREESACPRPCWVSLASPQASTDNVAAASDAASGAFPLGDDEAKPDAVPLHVALHRAGALPAQRARVVAAAAEQEAQLRERYGTHSPQQLSLGDSSAGLRLGRVFDQIVRRRSTRAYQQGGIPAEALGRIVAAAYAPQQLGLGEHEQIEATLLNTFVLVMGVDGLTSGLYYASPSSEQPCGVALRLLQAGDLRDAARFICLGQDLGGDAFALVIHTADLAQAVALHGERVYRSLHLDAGMLGERLNLAALAEGLGASGIGGFFDDDAARFCGIPEAEAIVYITTLGVPAHRAP